MGADQPRLFPIFQPPTYCEYASGACDQTFENARRSQGLVLYPNDPPIISGVVEEAVEQLRMADRRDWLTWKDLGVPGQIIFCEICKALRFTRLAVADVTTLNFNLLFEVGYAIGLGVAVLPIRDTSFIKDARVFGELGLIDTLGYLDFQNSADLVKGILAKGTPIVISTSQHPVDKERPLYVMKSPVQSEGLVRLMSSVKKSGLRFRAFDPRESPRLSLHDSLRQVSTSLGIVVHLMSPERQGSAVHNARCAFVAGLALATGKHVLML